MRTKDNLTIADYELLGQAYSNLIEAGLMIAMTKYDTFLEAVLTGEQVNFEEAL